MPEKTGRNKHYQPIRSLKGMRKWLCDHIDREIKNKGVLKGSPFEWSSAHSEGL